MRLNGFAGQINHHREPRSNLIVRIRDCDFSEVSASQVVRLATDKSNSALQVLTRARSGAG